MGTEIRLLAEADAAALDRFLRGQPSGITLRGAVALDGVASDRSLCAAALEGDEVVSVAALCRNGMLVVAPRSLEALLELLARNGRGMVTGITGLTSQVQRAREWMDATDARTLLCSRDELFQLELSRMREPDALRQGNLSCRQAGSDDRKLMASWRHDFSAENLGAQRGPFLLEVSGKAVEAEIARGTLYLLEDAGRPVATACFEPALPDAVQVANVFTPPELRGRGYARAVTAGALLQARTRGVTVGVLFTGLDNAPAQRAYRSLGFEPCGAFTTLIFAQARLPAPGG